MRKLLLLVMSICGIAASAQVAQETVHSWDFTNYSIETVKNLKADTEHWTFDSKGRFKNAVATDGLPLQANGVEIEETKGVIIAAGINPGSFLLRHAMGDNNGMQIEPNGGNKVTINDLQQGDYMKVRMMSSSKTARGIQAVENLDGEYGESTYLANQLRDYDFRVVADGSVAFEVSGGVVITAITVLRDEASAGDQIPTPVIAVADAPEEIGGVVRKFKSVTLTCDVADASIFYSIDKSDAQLYSGPIRITRSCTVKAYAQKPGYPTSEIASQEFDIPFAMPFKNQFYVLDPETLDRAAVATTATGKYLVNWRIFITDPDDISFNVYRNGEKINEAPILTSNFMDPDGKFNSVYTIEAVVNGEVTETFEAKTLSKGYYEIKLDRPEGGSTSSGKYEYVPGDCMVADVDGDNQYEIIMKWDPTNADESNSSSNDLEGAGQKDNSIYGHTANVLIDAYRMDGTKLWRIDLGCNIRAGAHYTQLMVYDLDGDGRAEVACKTAPGTIDGEGNYVLLGTDSPDVDYRNENGMIIRGSEYLTVFSGLTGKALSTVYYNPPRNIISGWGDSYGNRCERYLACVAYLDGEHPSLVMCRGYYTAAYLWAVDFDGTELTTRWLHVSDRAGQGLYGEGAHAISTGDVDGDGRDEIIYGSACLDDDGLMIYRTGLGHGDALHVGDFHPDRPGLEVMMVHEETSAKYGIELRDALTGEIISGEFAGIDVGRGLCADINPDTRGCEYWGYSNNVYDVDGNVISTKRPSINFRTYWDGDMYEELTERGSITKWSPSGSSTLLNVTSGGANAGTNLIKYTPNLQADILGDWREEQIYYDNSTKSRLFIFSTPYETEYRVPCLMHDHHYRMATVWQTSAYNQPPHLSFYLPDYIDAQAGVENVVVDGDAEIVGYRYYDLNGRLLPTAPDAGVFIRQNIRSNGTTFNEKLVR